MKILVTTHKYNDTFFCECGDKIQPTRRATRTDALNQMLDILRDHHTLVLVNGFEANGRQVDIYQDEAKTHDVYTISSEVSLEDGFNTEFINYKDYNGYLLSFNRIGIMNKVIETLPNIVQALSEQISILKSSVYYILEDEQVVIDPLVFRQLMKEIKYRHLRLASEKRKSLSLHYVVKYGRRFIEGIHIVGFSWGETKYMLSQEKIKEIN